MYCESIFAKKTFPFLFQHQIAKKLNQYASKISIKLVRKPFPLKNKILGWHWNMDQNCFCGSYSFQTLFLIHELKNLFRTKGFSACHSGILFFKGKNPFLVSNICAFLPLNIQCVFEFNLGKVSYMCIFGFTANKIVIKINIYNN